MATDASSLPTSEAAILSRVIHPEQADLPGEAAHALLELRLNCVDLDRLHQLVTKNQDDALSPAEKSELESYLRVSSFLDLMHAKARLSLNQHS